MKKLLLIVSTLIILLILALSYFGLIPVVSTAFGFNKPKDLGVSFSPQNLDQANQKTKVSIETLPDQTSIEKSLIYQGSHSTQMTLSSEEITAMANNSKWKYNPLSQVQVKINGDGTAEASGLIDFNSARQYALALGVSSKDIDLALEKFPIPTTKFPFYLKGTGGVENNQIQLNVTSLKLSNIPIPSNLINTYSPQAISFIEDKYLGSGSIKVEKLENQAGKIYFKGDLPDKELTVR